MSFDHVTCIFLWSYLTILHRCSASLGVAALISVTVDALHSLSATVLALGLCQLRNKIFGQITGT